MSFDAPPGAVQVDLDELGRSSAWPARLLGLAPWVTKKRTVEEILREYDREKYARVLQWLESTNPSERTMEAAQDIIEENWRTGVRVMSHRDKLYRVERDAFDSFRERCLATAVLPAAEGADAIVELGCGFGYQLWTLRNTTKLRLAGGLSPNAVNVAKGLLRPEHDMEIVPFNFYDEAAYARVLDASKGRRVTIYTVFAVQMLPTAQPFLDHLRRHRDRIHRVVNLEPSTGLFSSNSLLDQLRIAYTRANDYNMDLLELLERSNDIVIEKQEKDVVGQNPLAPINVLSWRFG